MTKLLLALAGAAALLLASAEARAAPAATPEEAAKPQASEGDGAKTGEDEAAKPEGAPSAGAERAAAPPETNSGPLTLAELTRDGFVIRTTNFIPAEAVTRQSGKVSSDAIMVTLQKTTATAVCFYTLKAYVSKKLSTIPACTVHR
jgi:hypothetical protein